VESSPNCFAQPLLDNIIVSWQRGQLMVKELRLRELHHVLGLIRVARPDVSKGILIVFH